ncbi:MAG: 16S rRNA (guanine(527)-N(7))-methyltransferase RsmG, partial [Candidatus Scatosoma sp.]
MKYRAVDIQENLKKIEGEYREKFEAFRAYLLEFNEKYNLTTITEEKETTYKHFLDSSVTASFFNSGESVAEIGSGAGFPSLPIKIFRDDLRFTLFESVGKKCEFLRFIVDKLQL